MEPSMFKGYKMYQKVNHFPQMAELARKTNLGRNLKRMKKLFPKMWAKLSFADRGDMASRLHSSLHAVVCWGHIIGFSTCDIWFDYYANDCAVNEFFFAMTAGYFFFDFFLTCHYKVSKTSPRACARCSHDCVASCFGPNIDRLASFSTICS